MNKEEYIELYRKMLLIRRFEERAAQMYTQAKISGFLHLYIGQEAVAVGFMPVLGTEDYIISAYRDHGHILARGTDPKYVMAELFGKSTGVSGGKGGSMHMFDVKRGFLGGYGIVGGGIPLAAGVGFACKYQSTNRICINFFGDGAVNEGSFHESLNLAALWNLPVLFVVENNFYGMGTPVRLAASIPDLIQRGACYDLEREQVDGMDVLACRDVAERSYQRLREGKGPKFIEAITYRFRGHSMSDPDTYRSTEEKEMWKKRDPVTNYEKKLMEMGFLNEQRINQIQDDIKKIIDDAVKFADESPFPPPDALYENVYA